MGILNEVADRLEPWYRSFEGELGKSKIGSAASEMIKNMYEPLLKKTQATQRVAIEKELATVPEHLHADVTKHALTGLPHTNTAVHSAAQNLGKLYQSQRVMKPVLIDQTAKAGNEMQRWLNWNQQYAKRYARETVFGEKDEALVAIVKQAYRETGRHTYANNVADGFSMLFRESGGGDGIAWRRQAGKGAFAVPELEARSPYYDTKKLESQVRSSMSHLLTARIAIPHMTQVMNSVLVNGSKATAHAIGDLMSDRKMALDRVMASGAMEDEIHFNLEDVIKKQGASKVGKILLSIKQPGFKTVRKWQMVISGIGGKYAAKDYAQQLIANPGDKAAPVALKFFGLDPQDVLQHGGLTPEMEDKAIFRAVEEAMFIRSGMHTPPAWDKNPMTRMAFMYKHYMFNEGRLVADTLKRSYKMGPVPFLKTLAFIGVAFPMAGQMTKMVLNMATGHNPTETPESVKLFKGAPLIDDYIDAMGHVAGFGMGYTLMRSAKRKALADTLIGPIIGTAADLTQDVANGNANQFARDVGNKLGAAGPLITNQILPSKKKHGGSMGLGSGLGRL